VALQRPYEMLIDVDHPALVVVLVDQSDSMQRESGHDRNIKKAIGVADAVNTLLHNLVVTCTRQDVVKDFFHVSVIGYGRTVGLRLQDPDSFQSFVPISRLAKKAIRTEERAMLTDDGSFQNCQCPVWLEPFTDGLTPMCEMFRFAREVVADFLSDYSNCFPPVIVNITDGESSDGDPTKAAEELKKCSSINGNVLLFNVHISSMETKTIAFPARSEQLPDRFSRLMFNLSSELPDVMVNSASRYPEYKLEPGARGFIFNASMADVSRMLAIGTVAGFAQKAK